MILGNWMEDLAMTRSIIDTKFPYVLVCSTFGAIVSLASVCLSHLRPHARRLG